MCYMPKLEQTKLDNITIKEEGRQSLFEVNKMEKLGCSRSICSSLISVVCST